MSAISRIIRPAAAIAVTLSLALAIGQRPASAKIDVGTLYNHAALDFDQLQYFVERDVVTEISPVRKKTSHILDEYDQVHNREQARDDETLSTKDKSGTWHTQHRVLEIVMLNNKTYWRTSSSGAWQVKKGFGYKDTSTWSDDWVRAAPLLPPVTAKYVTMVGQSGNQTHLHIHGLVQKQTVTFDVWVTSGTQPYVVRLLDQGTAKKAGQTETDTIDGRYNAFNQPITIAAPPGTGGQST